MSNRCQCGKPAPHATICESCTKTLRTSLRKIGGYIHDLADTQSRNTRYGSNTAKPSIGKEQPLILDMRFTDKAGKGSQLEYDLRATLVAWVRITQDHWPEYKPVDPICDICNHQECVTARRRAWPADTTTAMCAYLLRMTHSIAGATWAAEILDELLDLEHRLQRFVDRPAERWYAGICGNPQTDDRTHNAASCGCGCHYAPGLPCDIEGGCGIEYAVIPGARCAHELWAQPGAVFIRCRECGHTWSSVERRDNLLAEARDRLATIEVILQICDTLGTPAMRDPKNSGRVRQWAVRGRITPHGERVVFGRPRPLYRVGDVLDMLDAPNEQEQTGY